MKLNFKSVLVASLAFFMTSCTQSPMSVAEDFSNALAKGKVEEAKQYCTENTAKMIDMASSMGSLKIDPNYKFNCLRDSIVDNTAYVFYTENESTKERMMTLYKIDGEWKVNMKGK